jgi:hypothetical protein
MRGMVAEDQIVLTGGTSTMAPPPITFLIGPAMGFPASGPGMTAPPC